MLTAHREFINRLEVFRFAADFYENLIGVSTVRGLADAAGDFLISGMADTNIAILFAEDEPGQIHFYGSNTELEEATSMLGSALTARLAREVCRSNRICSQKDLLEMGLAGSPAVMKKTSIAAIGFGNTVSAKGGTVVFYKDSKNPLSRNDLTKVAAVMRGFAKAVNGCRDKTNWQSA